MKDQKGNMKHFQAEDAIILSCMSRESKKPIQGELKMCLAALMWVTTPRVLKEKFVEKKESSKVTVLGSPQEAEGEHNGPSVSRGQELKGNCSHWHR